MRSNQKMIVILSLCAAFFAAAALLLRLDVFSGLSGSEEESEETIVCVLPAGDVTAIHWTGGSAADFSLEKAADGSWGSPAAPDVALDQEKIQETVAALCQIISNRTLDGDDAASYGLSPARRTVALTFANGETVRYLLGDLNPYTNRYYFRMNEEDAIYAVGFSVGRSMEYTVLDYAMRPVLPDMVVERLAHLSLTGEQGEFSAVRSPQQVKSIYRSDVNWFLQDGGDFTPLDSARIDERAAQLKMLSFGDCVSVAPAGEELKQWQLDEPRAALEVLCYPDTADGGTDIDHLIFRLRIGAEREDGTCYVQTEENGAVFLMSTQPLNELMGILEDDLASLLLCPVQVKQMRSVTVSGETVRRLELNWSEDGQLTATENGTPADAGTVSVWLEKLTALKAQDHLPAPDVQPDGLLWTVAVDCGDVQLQLDFYSGDVAFVLARVGETFYRVPTETVEALLS